LWAMVRRASIITLLMFIFVLPSTVAPNETATQKTVLVVGINGEITLATEAMIKDALGMARTSRTQLIIVKLDTPGGEANAMKSIMALFESSEIPICVFVYPPGASAWSAGTYLLMASHIAAMASGTTIGSCQPALATGEPINASKYLNAYAALIEHHAKLHCRNETMARLFVLQNINLGPDDAFKNHVIELMANDVGDLLEKLEGFTLIYLQSEYGLLVWKLVPNDEVQRYTYVRKISFSGIHKADIIEYTPGIQAALLGILLNPLVSSLLLVVGIYLLLSGIHTPGYGAEIAGGICIFLALIAFGAVGITLGAVILFALGALLILVEIKTHIGVLAISGIVCMILGSMLLFPSPRWLIHPQLSERIQQFVVGVALCMSAFFAILVYKVAKAKRRKVITGAEALEGARGVAVSDIKPKGQVRVLGEYWQAISDGREIQKGQEVEVVGRKGLLLIVKPVKERFNSPSKYTRKG